MGCVIELLGLRDLTGFGVWLGWGCCMSHNGFLILLLELIGGMVGFGIFWMDF